MEIAQIDDFEVCNGENVGVSLYVRGCPHKCPGCFNKKLWKYGRKLNIDLSIKSAFYRKIDKPYIKRVTFVGGEPLADPNVDDVVMLAKEISEIYSDKKIWVYSGYTYEEIVSNEKRKEILRYIDVLVDGRFVEELKDLSLPFRGSSNQRIIDVKKTNELGKVVLKEI